MTDVWIPYPGDRVDLVDADGTRTRLVVVDHTPHGCGGAVTVTAADGPVREAETILGGQR